MAETTAKRMNLLFQKNTERINSAVSTELKKLMEEAERKLNMNESLFIKMAIIEKLDRMDQ